MTHGSEDYLGTRVSLASPSPPRFLKTAGAYHSCPSPCACAQPVETCAFRYHGII